MDKWYVSVFFDNIKKNEERENERAKYLNNFEFLSGSIYIMFFVALDITVFIAWTFKYKN